MKYIDISEHQGEIDFSKVKGSVDGVMIRCGYGQNGVDKQFTRNISECNRLGIPCGVYFFSYAYTAEMAKKEALRCLAMIEPYRVELPVAFDWEYDSADYAKRYGVTPTPALVNSMVKAFCGEIEAAGYYAMNYANPDFLSRYMTDVARYDLWLATWPKVVDVKKPPRKCGIWQWGGSTVPGINGSVDTNEAYKDYARNIRDAGLNRLHRETPGASPQPTEEDESPQPTEEVCADCVIELPKTVSAAEVKTALEDVLGYMDKRFSGLLEDE